MVHFKFVKLPPCKLNLLAESVNPCAVSYSVIGTYLWSLRNIERLQFCYISSPNHSYLPPCCFTVCTVPLLLHLEHNNVRVKSRYGWREREREREKERAQRRRSFLDFRKFIKVQKGPTDINDTTCYIGFLPYAQTRKDLFGFAFFPFAEINNLLLNFFFFSFFDEIRFNERITRATRERWISRKSNWQNLIKHLLIDEICFR